MIIVREGNRFDIFSGTDAAPGKFVGSVAVHPNEGPVDSDAILSRLGVRVTHFEYDFDVEGGAIAGRYISDAIPSGARVLGGQYKVDTTFTSATDAGTVSLGVEAEADLVAATAISTGTTWDAASPVNALLSTKDTVLLTADRRIRLDIKVEAVTAGKLWGFVLWALSPEVTHAAV